MSSTSTGLNPGYETTFITKNELADEALKQLQDRLTQVAVLSTTIGSLPCMITLPARIS